MPTLRRFINRKEVARLDCAPNNFKEDGDVIYYVVIRVSHA
jgi:hypothetical protein